jgi:hypothetical protein
VILVRRKTVGTGCQSKVKLDLFVRGVRLQPVDPSIKSKGALLLALHVLDCLGSRAGPGVIELGEEEVEMNLLKSIKDPGIGDHALRSAREKHGRVFLDVLAEDIVVLPDHIRGHIPLCGFEVEIETVDECVAERTGLARCFPRRSNGSVSPDQELGKPVGHVWCWQVVVGWPTATEGEHDFLAIRSANVDGFTDAGT